MASKTQPFFDAPIGELIHQMGREIAGAQANINAYSFSVERQLERAKSQTGIELQAPWLHLPEIEIEMHVALNYVGQKAEKNKPGYRCLHAAPINPTFLNFFNYHGQNATKVKMTFRSVPSPE